MPDASDAPPTLGELALEVRSKNAGPFWMTLEAFMPDEESYRIADALITAELISELYHVTPATVEVLRPDPSRTTTWSACRITVGSWVAQRTVWPSWWAAAASMAATA